jgi:hypothetical protein
MHTSFWEKGLGGGGRMKTTRRAILLAGVAIIDPGSGGIIVSDAPQALSQLLARRAEAAKRNQLSNTAADELAFALRRGEPQALARADELPSLRQLEESTFSAVSGLDRQIVAFAAQTLDDLVIKLRLYAHEQGYLAEAEEEDENESYETRLLLSVLRDLEHMAEARS